MPKTNIFVGFTQGIEGLCDNENVINPDTKEQEGDDCVGCGVEKTEHWTQPIAEDHTHGDTIKPSSL